MSEVGSAWRAFKFLSQMAKVSWTFEPSPETLTGTLPALSQQHGSKQQHKQHHGVGIATGLLLGLLSEMAKQHLHGWRPLGVSPAIRLQFPLLCPSPLAKEAKPQQIVPFCWAGATLLLNRG
jgi:hypothetical protein